MTEAWVSNERRFCDFCKCWLSASKPATEFHERGKNHQENVKRRLAEIKKKSMDKRQDDEESKNMFEQMERDALAAVQKDIASNSSSIGRFDMKNVQKAKEDENPTYPWSAIEAQGHTYWYNSLTGESTWEKPAIVEEAERKKKAELPRSEPPPPPPVERRKQLTGGNCQPISNAQQFNSQSSEVSPVFIETLGEVKDEHPLYGGWQTVTRTYVDSSSTEENTTSPGTTSCETDRTTDLGIPTDDSTSKPVVNPLQEDAPVTERKTFKQKVLKSSLETTSSDGGEVTFKKRKFGAGKSTRKRTTGDDDN